MGKKFAVAAGLETFLDTASDDDLGSGATSLGPQVFSVFLNPLDFKGTLFAPAYQHKFSVDVDDGREDIHQGLIDLYVVWISPNKQYWSIFDPQIILDYEQDIEYPIIDLEVGTMLDKWFGTKGHSVYIRPSVGVGGDRSNDGSIEVGYKFIW